MENDLEAFLWARNVSAEIIERLKRDKVGYRFVKREIQKCSKVKLSIHDQCILTQSTIKVECFGNCYTFPQPVCSLYILSLNTKLKVKNK